MPPLTRVLLAFIAALLSAAAATEQLTVAVAANFAPTLRELAPLFEAQSGIRLVLVPGSTGKHYAQIRHGAPFDLFFAADQRTPSALEDAGSAVSGSRFTYAVGRLVLWQPPTSTAPTGADALAQGTFERLAIANPRLAPYGAAAQAALEELGLWPQIRDNLVRGENINQAFQFVRSGAADAGLVALAQMTAVDPKAYWVVPQRLHPPIVQQAVILRPSCAALELVAFIESPAAQAVVEQYGYTTPARTAAVPQLDCPASDGAAQQESGQRRIAP